MKTLECKVCGHIEFEEANGQCLVCRAEDSFVENAEAIKSPADPTALTDAEKKHIPQIVIVKECGLIPDECCTDVHVRVGEIKHLMTQEHYIRYIDYYLNKKFISRVWLSPEVCNPACALHLADPKGTITAIENCNLHGNWMAEADI